MDKPEDHVGEGGEARGKDKESVGSASRDISDMPLGRLQIGLGIIRLI